MAYRQNMGLANQGYPTGRSPMALDLYSPTVALTQQMMKLKNKEFDLKKEQIDDSSKRITEALDFETIKGLGQEVQRKHLDRLSEFNDKWSEEYAGAETPGVLPEKKLQEMEFEKKLIEQDMATMRSKVNEFAKVQQLAIENMEQYQETGLSTFDPVQTAENLANYNDFIGDPSKSPMQMLVPRKKPVSEVINMEYGELIDDHSKRFFDREVDKVENGYVYFKDGNKKDLKNLKGAIVADMRLKGGAKHLGTKFSPEEVDAAIQSRIDLVTGIKGTVQQKQERAAPSSGKDYSKETANLNTFLEGVRKKNKTQLEMLKTKVGADSYSYQDETNSMVFYDVPSKEGAKPDILATIKLPEEGASEDEVRQWKIGLNSKYPLLKGREYSQDIVGDYSKEAELGEIKEPEAQSMVSLRGVVNISQDDWEKEADADQRKKVDKTARYLKKYLPEGASVSTATDGKKRRVIVKDADGKKTIYKLDQDSGGGGTIRDAYKGRKEFGEFVKSLEKKESKKVDPKADITEADYANLKVGDKYWYGGVEYTKNKK